MFLSINLHDITNKGEDLGPYLLNFVSVNINAELSYDLKLVKLRLHKER
jgi:hypothetical protein